MDNLIGILKAGGNHKEPFTWPGTDKQLSIKIATEQDNTEASKAASDFFKGYPIGHENIREFETEKLIQILFRCIIDPETNERAFKNITDFRESLTPEIVSFLDDEHDIIHEKYAVNPDEMTDEQFDKFVDDLKKNYETTISNISNIHDARKLIIYLVKRLNKSQEASGSI